MEVFPVPSDHQLALQFHSRVNCTVAADKASPTSGILSPDGIRTSSVFMFAVWLSLVYSVTWDSDIKTRAANHPHGTALVEVEKAFQWQPDIKHESHRPCTKIGIFKKSCLLLLLCYTSGIAVPRGAQINNNLSIRKDEIVNENSVSSLWWRVLLFSTYWVSSLPFHVGRKFTRTPADGFSHVTCFSQWNGSRDFHSTCLIRLGLFHFYC